MAQHNTEKHKPMDDKAKPRREQPTPSQREQPTPGRDQHMPDQDRPADQSAPRAPEPRGERSDKESIGQPVQLDRERA